MLADFADTLRYYGQFIRANVRAQMQYRFNFWFLVVGVVIFYVTQFLAIWLVMGRFKSLAGWVEAEIHFVFGLWVLAYGLAVFFFRMVRDFPYLVHTGILDPYYLRPRNMLLQLMAAGNETAAIGHCGLGITILMISAYRLHFSWGVGNLLFLVACALGGALIQAGIMLFNASLSFWTTQGDRFFDILFSMNRDYFIYPLIIYDRWVQILGTAILPFAFIGVVPAQALLHKQDGVWIATGVGYLAPAVGLAFFLLAYLLFTRGLRRYQGVGG